MTESPNLSNRRTKPQPKPAPDEGRDPIDPPTRKPVEKLEEVTVAKLPRINIETTPEVFETLEFAKFKTKKSKRALVEEAVLAHWANYRTK
ncbi:hypothetical protein ACFO7V_18455 [Glutamicibacter bergerei]|uniref:CopG family transcriptional regulator n=1 Tax=Glutamicibacter bergerei TaxID=256702 RepID=A0ABV9MRC8_9MICC